MSGDRHYRVFVVETRVVEVDLWCDDPAKNGLIAQRIAERVANDEEVPGARIVKRHRVRRQASTTCWMNNPDRISPKNQPTRGYTRE